MLLVAASENEEVATTRGGSGSGGGPSFQHIPIFTLPLNVAHAHIFTRAQATSRRLL